MSLVIWLSWVLFSQKPTQGLRTGTWDQLVHSLQGRAGAPHRSVFGCPAGMNENNGSTWAGCTKHLGHRMTRGEVVYSTAGLRHSLGSITKAPDAGDLFISGLCRDRQGKFRWPHSFLFQAAQSCWAQPHLPVMSMFKRHIIVWK